MRIAIHQNHEIFHHSTAWDKEWIKYCDENKIEYDVVNGLDSNILETIRDYDALLWQICNYSLQDMLFARSVLSSAKNIGLKVFPDFKTSWHFDDKVAETYLLQSINAPIPESWIFYTYASAINYFKKDCNYPVVAKLRCGAGSSNVKLICNEKDGLKYAQKMFGEGYNAAPNVLFKTKSNIRSAKDFDTIMKRFRRIPDFVETLSKANEFPKEKGYVYLQEFIPNDGYDIKVVVVGNKLSFLIRNVRKGDFRASGGGSICYDKALITPKIREIAFDLSDRLGFQSMGYDFVVDSRDRTEKIVEISYGFSHTAQMELGGYWDREGVWYEEPLNAPKEILHNIITEIKDCL
jgi:glutathione synthase/RimK-type ligase-like ATP-grasp enzyme